MFSMIYDWIWFYHRAQIGHNQGAMQLWMNLLFGKPDNFSTNWSDTNAINKAYTSPQYFWYELIMFEYIYLFICQPPLCKKRKTLSRKKRQKS